jgi:hypothetical protein
MANWLNKYEQGGLVLKKKTKDNYGKKPNVNDVKASVGPDFVGLGYNTKGRDYSPAWGGQFQDGGKLTLPEAIVYGHKDPKVKDYFDKVRTDAEKWRDEYYWNTPTAGYHALEQMHSKYGAPKINTIREKDRAYYNPITDSMNISIPKYGDEYGDPVEDQFLHELAHKVQANKKGNVGFVKDFVGKDLINTLKNVDSSDIFTKKGWLDAYRKNYHTPGTVENEAHSVIAPKLEEEYRDIRSKQYDRLYGDMAMGGSLPGAVGFTYARVAGSAPANGKYTKKTKASAQNGKEMSFYQNGLDFKPKSISKNGSVIKDDRGQWAHPGEVTEIGSNDITMQGVDYPVLGVSDTGDTQMMYPDQDYKFDGEKVTEYPMAQAGRNVPTQADSLRVYNAALATLNYYKNDKRHIAPKIDEFDPIISRADVNAVGNENLNRYRQMYKELVNNGEDKFTSRLYKKDYKESKQQLLNKIGKAIVEAKSAPPGISYYKDAYPSKIDINAPSAIIDERIKPQGWVNFKSNDEDYRSAQPAGSVTGMWYYDPLAVKPYNMRTEEEKIKWNKKYGKETPKPKPKQPVSKPTPKPTLTPQAKPEPAPVVTKQPTPEQPTPQPKPLYEYEGEQVMAPVPSGGGSAMVGVKKKDGTIEYIKPEDYQRMGVPKYGQDYIKSKQKMKEGGWLNKYK